MAQHDRSGRHAARAILVVVSICCSACTFQVQGAPDPQVFPSLRSALGGLNAYQRLPEDALTSTLLAYRQEFARQLRVEPDLSGLLTVGCDDALLSFTPGRNSIEALVWAFYSMSPVLRDCTDPAALLGLASVEEALIQSVMVAADGSYLSINSVIEMEQDLSHPLSDIGVDVELEGGLPHVERTRPLTPACDAGINSGDVILEVDGTSTQGMPLQTIVQQMRGKDGTQVELLVERAGESEPKRLSLRRAAPLTDAVEAAQIGDGIGYLRIFDFGGTEPSRASEELARLQSAGVRSLILDLRDNTGGHLVSVSQTADLFLAKGQSIGEIRTLEGSTQTPLVAEAGDRADGMSLAIVMNQRTASGAEMFAAALRREATLVGEVTAGQGELWSAHPLPNGGGILLRTGEFYAADGRSIEGSGIEPDVRVSDQPGDSCRSRQGASLEAAIELLSSGPSTSR
jgi:C-terminal peptidase prc